MSKNTYAKPTADKLEFDYANSITASGGGKNPAQCTGHNPGQGCTGGAPGQGNSVGNSSPGNCSVGGQRKNANKGCF